MNIIAEPLSRLMHLVYDLVGHYGISIIVFTVIVKLLMIPLTVKQAKSMKNMQEIQPKINEIQKQYKNDKEKMNQKVMELYKEHNVNPMGGCLPLLIQFPIIIGLFTVLRTPEEYGFAKEVVDAGFLWMSSMMEPDPWILPLLAGITTFISSKTMQTKPGTGNPQQESMQKMMLYFFPVMIAWMGRTFPAGLTLYWVVSNVFQAGQQMVINGPAAILPGKRSDKK